jgi:uncharacterized membrane protein
LTVVVVGYDDADVALTDYGDLVLVIEDRKLQDCEAVVIRRDGSEHEVLASTVAAEERDTRLGACLGVIVGLAVSPAVATVVVGGGFGALIGNVIDQAKGIKHANLTEVERLIDESAANLIAIADTSTNTEIVDRGVATGTARDHTD